MQDTVQSIIASKAKTKISFRGESLKDALNFGFSYIESKDHVVHYVTANPVMLKRILAEISESILDPTDESIGDLWTAKLLMLKRLGNKELVFSNNTFSTVINVNLNGG